MSFNLKNIVTAQVSVPNAAGISNVPVDSGLEGGDIGVQSSMEVIDDALELLESYTSDASAMSQGDAERASRLKNEILSKLPNEIIDKIEGLESLPDVLENPMAQVGPEAVGDEQPLASVRLRISNIADKLKDEKMQMNQEPKVAQKKEPKTTYEKKEEKEKGKEGKGKKSNPWRYLMGQVEKLMDRGWSRSEIQRHINKHDKFDRDMIGKAYDDVKKRGKKKSSDDSKKSSAFNLKSVFAQIEERKVEDEGENVYQVEPDIDTKSTRELLNRYLFLRSAEEFDPDKDASGTRNNAPKELKGGSVKKEMNEAKQALLKRDLSESDIEEFYKDFNENRYYPFGDAVSAVEDEPVTKDTE